MYHPTHVIIAHILLPHGCRREGQQHTQGQGALPHVWCTHVRGGGRQCRAGGCAGCQGGRQRGRREARAPATAPQLQPRRGLGPRSKEGPVGAAHATSMHCTAPDAPACELWTRSAADQMGSRSHTGRHRARGTRMEPPRALPQCARSPRPHSSCPFPLPPLDPFPHSPSSQRERQTGPAEGPGHQWLQPPTSPQHPQRFKCKQHVRHWLL